MNSTIINNFTGLTGIPIVNPFELITKTCLDWCKEQTFIHQSNIGIQDLSLIAIALVSLVIHNLIDSHAETLMNYSGMDEEQLAKVYDATYTFTFLMLVIYIIYMLFIK